MEDTQTTSEERVNAPLQREELTRPVAGRMIAGVSQGLANRFKWPTWVIRVGFIVTCFIGGLGLVLYLAGWALLRSEDEPDTPAERFFAGTTSVSSWIGVGIILTGALILVVNFSFVSGEVLFALILMAIGALLYTGYINGPSGGPKDGARDDNKEGVQQVTTTDTLVPDTETTAGDSPVGGSAPPPATPTPLPPEPAPAKPKETSILGRLTLGVMLLGMGVLAILDQIDSIPIDTEPRHYLAMAVTILGIGLLVGAFAGRARWLIILGALLVPILLFSPAFEYDWTSDAFDSVERPTSFDQVQAVYSQDLGNMLIDLTALPWDGERVILRAHVDVGNLEIRIPSDVGLAGSASVDIGRAAGPNQESWGLGDPTVEFNRTGEAGLVELDLAVDVGNVEVNDIYDPRSN